MEVDAEVLGSGSFVHLRLRSSGFYALVVADVSSTGMGLVVRSFVFCLCLGDTTTRSHPEVWLHAVGPQMFLAS